MNVPLTINDRKFHVDFTNEYRGDIHYFGAKTWHLWEDQGQWKSYHGLIMVLATFLVSPACGVQIFGALTLVGRRGGTTRCWVL